MTTLTAMPVRRQMTAMVCVLWLITAALLVSSDWPKWVVMWSLAVATFGLCKWLSWVRQWGRSASGWRSIGYWLTWPGLDPVPFVVDVGPRFDRPRAGAWWFAAGKTSFGVLLLATSVALVPHMDPFVAGWVGMVGLIFTLHFGLFDLLSCGWRSLGVNALPLMNWPILATSVSDFWGRRWNRAFRDLSYRLLFQPLSSRFGGLVGTFAAFLVSGLVHELVITVPAGAGYGGPTAYFIGQGLAIVVERSAPGRRLGLGRGAIGRLFAAGVALLPINCLFPRAFVVDVIVPSLQFLGGLR